MNDPVVLSSQPYVLYTCSFLILKALPSNVFSKAFIISDSVRDFSNVSAKVFSIIVGLLYTLLLLFGCLLPRIL